MQPACARSTPPRPLRPPRRPWRPSPTLRWACAARRAWEEFIPFLELPPEIRRVVYTTNAIESINYQLRKVTKTRGQFPNDAAAYKLLYLAICDIEVRTTTRGGNDKTKKTLLQRGASTQHWTQALNHFAIIYPGRLPEAL